jgi:hypothetical protein
MTYQPNANTALILARALHAPWNEGTRVIGRDLARKLDKKEGDEIMLGAAKFQIIGICFSRSTLENSSIIAPLAAVFDSRPRPLIRFGGQPLTLPGEITAFGILADPSLDAEGLKSLRKRLAAVQPGLEVSTTKPHKAERPAAPPPDDKAP